MMTSVLQGRKWFWESLKGVRVGAKILGLALGITLLLGFSLIWQMRRTQENTLRAELKNNGTAITRDLSARSAEFILLDDLYSLHNLLQDTQKNNESVRYAFIVDDDGYPLAHSFSEGFPRGLIDANAVGPTERYHIQRLETNEGVIWDVATPILSGEGGTARVGLSEAKLRETVNTTTKQFLFTTTFIALLGLSAATFLTWLITRPINQLVIAARAVAAGDFSTRVTPWGADEVGILADAFNQMIDQLGRADREREDRDQLRGLLIDKIITAQEEERRRIARELHDDTGQALTAIRMGLTNALDACKACAHHGKLDELNHLTRSTLDNVRQLALELRPPVLDDLGLGAALRRYVYDWGRTYNIAVSFESVGLDGIRLEPPIETAVYRITQEALTNVARHAQATRVDVVLERRKNECIAIIEDDGRGFDQKAAHNARHLGLTGMEERAKLISGNVTIETECGKGTTIFVRVPLQLQELEQELPTEK